ncbi:MAG: metallophosphoesterase, partial [Chloroflexota bacterium]
GSSGSTGTAVNGPVWTGGNPFESSPLAPVLAAPADGGTPSASNLTLDVVVQDPPTTTDPLSVTYYGRTAGTVTWRKIGTTTGVASGSHATIVWPNLVTGTAYEWFVQVTNGTGWTVGPTWRFTTDGPPHPVMVGAGDIASCTSTGDEATATLLDDIAGTVFTLGDNAYPNGTALQYSSCYDPSWGRQKARTIPVVGNHDYGATEDASGYFGYFGTAAGNPTQGWYSFDLGTWHVIVLNGECVAVGGCQPGSSQLTWLRLDLAAHPNTCTLALWHEARFSSSLDTASDMNYQAFWQALYDYNADLVVNGHSHMYERFAPQTPAGVSDPVNGIRELVAGTGGDSHASLGTIAANSEVRNIDTYGVLKLTLNPGGYDWQFIPVAGKTFTDEGSGSCH